MEEEEEYVAVDIRTPLIRQSAEISSSYLRHMNVKFIMACILITVVFERLAYYSLLGNLTVFLNMSLDWSPTEAVTLTLIFSGLTWISCFIGGLLGDAYLGRYKTIIIGLIFYIIGFACLPLIAHFGGPGHVEDISGTNPFLVLWLCFALLLISLGEGLFKANMSPFGADQITRSREDKLRSFFSFFYWAINVGSFLGFGGMTFLQLQKTFVIGYAVSAGCLALGGMIFCLPKRESYVLGRPVVNVMKKICHIIKEARKNKNRSRNHRNRPDGTQFEDFVPIQHWLDRAMVKYGGSHLEVEVQEVKTVFKIIPVFGFLIVYCILYYQVTGTFILQGMHMLLPDMGTMHFPSAWLGLFNVIFVIIFIPVADKGLYPCLEKFGVKMPYLVRMAIGMLLGSVSMVAAGLVEYKRLQTSGNCTNYVAGRYVSAKSLSIFYQVPQFAIMGISEIFVMITGLEYAYCQAPKSMQSLVTGLFFIVNGIGSMLGSLLIVIGNQTRWPLLPIQTPSKDQRKPIGHLKGNLHLFFFSLAVINLLNWIFFVVFAYRRRPRPNQSIEHGTVQDYIKATHSKSKRTTSGHSRSLEI